MTHWSAASSKVVSRLDTNVITQAVNWLLNVLRNAEEFKNYAAAVQSIVTTLALFVGGIWVLRQFSRFRKGKPKINLTLEVGFIRRQGSQWRPSGGFDEVLGLWGFGFIANDIKTAFD